MRRAAAAAFVIAGLAGAARAQEADVAAASRIARVTVYEDRALVTRVAKVAVPSGVARVRFEHLPTSIDVDSLRARAGVGAANARILGIAVETVHLAREARAALQQAQDALTAATRKREAAEMALQEARDRWDLLRSLRATTVERTGRSLGEGTNPDVASIKSMLEFVGSEAADARREVTEATTAVEQAKAEEDAARRRVGEVEGGAARSELRVIVSVATQSAADADVSLQYLVPGASWRPVYDVRVAEDFGGVSLGLSAIVQQRTGEDWGDVDLELTTARPSAGAAPPEPEPWRVDLRHEESGGFVRMRKAAPKADASAAVELMDKDEDAYAPEIRRSGLVVAFQAQKRETVRAGADPARVALGRFDLDPSVRWTAFPRVTKDVFVTTKLVNTTGTPLPAGEARVFVGPDFTGRMALADWGMGKEVDVGLGVDREVEAEREALVKQRSTEGIFSKDTVHERGFRITVTNHRARSIDVRLLDQIPVSADEDIEVELTETSLAFAKLPEREEETNKARGVLEWRFGVAAQAKQEVRFAFTVTHPKSTPIVGFDD